MAEISGPFLQALDVGVRTQFNQFLTTVKTQFSEIAMTIPSTTRENFYPKLNALPGLREWIGDRVIHRLSQSGFSIVNRTFESTISISRDDIEDDQFGIFNLGVQQLGVNAGVFPDELVFGLLNAAGETQCWDGQNYFDTDHETSDMNGHIVSYANVSMPTATETAGAAWYLFDTTRPLKPFIYQTRRPFGITSKVALDDDNVFRSNEFLWGTDGRCNAGFGLWQLAYKSTRPLTAESYGAARAAMSQQRRIDGVSYGITPNLLVVPPSLEGAANALMSSDIVPGLSPDGKTYLPVSNPWKGTARVLKSTYLKD